LIFRVILPAKRAQVLVEPRFGAAQGLEDRHWPQT
jgi:hypothetical protein